MSGGYHIGGQSVPHSLTFQIAGWASCKLARGLVGSIRSAQVTGLPALTTSPRRTLAPFEGALYYDHNDVLYFAKDRIYDGEAEQLKITELMKQYGGLRAT